MSFEAYGQNSQTRPADDTAPVGSTPPSVPEAYRSEYPGTHVPQNWQTGQAPVPPYAAPPWHSQTTVPPAQSQMPPQGWATANPPPAWHNQTQAPQNWQTQASPQSNPPVQQVQTSPDWRVQASSTASEFQGEDTASEPTKRKGKLVLGLIALALVFTLLGGAVGGLIMRGLYASDLAKTSLGSVEEKATRGSEQRSGNKNETAESSTATKRQSAGAPLSTPDIVEMAAPATVAIYADKTARNMFGDMKYIGSGSGVLISSDGYIITNNHVVGDSTNLAVTLSDGSEYQAKLVGTNEIVDIAVIKIEAGRDLPFIEFGSSEELRVGETVIAIGNPLGELQGTVSQGIVSAMHRDVTIENQPMEDLIQIDAPINSGNSGGALLNTQGKLVGINVAKSTGGLGDSVEGIAFAIPADKAKQAADDIMRGTSTLRPMIGISAEAVSPELAKQENIPEGILVVTVVSGSPAEKAGLQAGDVIVEAEGQAVISVAELNLIKNKLRVGDTMTLLVNRAGKELTVTLTLAQSTN